MHRSILSNNYQRNLSGFFRFTYEIKYCTHTSLNYRKLIVIILIFPGVNVNILSNGGGNHIDIG